MRGAFGKPGVPFLLSQRAHLLTTHEVGDGIPPVGQARALCEADAAPSGAFGQCHILRDCCHRPRSRLEVLLYPQNRRMAIRPPFAVCLRKPATGSFVAERVSQFTTPFSFSQKETKTRIRCLSVSHKAKGCPVAGRPWRER